MDIALRWTDQMHCLSVLAQVLICNTCPWAASEKIKQLNKGKLK
jgi:hypothetical protein